jgi:signal transduction histidine kinase
VAREDPSSSEVELLRLENRKLRDQLIARDDFVSIVAHELRNPLSPAYLQAQHIRDISRNNPNELRPEWLTSQMDDLVRRLERFLSTLNRVLDVSRINSGRVDLAPETVDLAALVITVAGDFEREAELAGSELTVDFEPVEGSWDRGRLEQIISNLISNAIRYGAGKPIELTVYDAGDVAMFRIRDHGIGIAEDAQRRIFERFERASVGLPKGGFGVGLWVVKKLCDAMKARISLESRLNEGTIFSIELPKWRNGHRG